MTLDPGARLGPYEIDAPIGAGGMGEVYKARDTRLDRTVAVKVLPTHFSEEPALKQRFEREAKAISSLQHPNICALFDVGSENGVDYLVMEYLEGETLGDRLVKGALPPGELLRMGIQVAGALDRAHRSGVVHRDLKPGNIMLTGSGVKLLDFGLAKLGDLESRPASGSIPGLSGMMTAAEEKPLTREGTILGTFQYMAPEQLESKEADARSDIFAFGSVLYEAATGEKAFEGDSQASLIAKIMSSEPRPITDRVPMTPPALDRVVRTCLAKDPDRRFQSAHDLKLQLEWILEGGSQAGVPAPVTARRRRREHLWMGASAVLLVAAIGLGYLSLGTSEPPSRPMKLSFLHTASGSSPQFGYPALSPDGTRMAYIGFDEHHRTVIYLRDLSGSDAVALPGTETALVPFWSPDGRYLGFFADSKLKKVDTSGGPPQVLCAAEGSPRGGTWNDRGDILFSTGRSSSDPIWRVPAAGGDPVEVTEVDSTEEGHLWPSFLPDGEHFVYLGDASSAENHHLRLGSLDGTVDKKLSNEISNFQFVPPRYLLFGKSGVLVAQEIDLDALELAGDPVALERDVVSFGGHCYQFTASNNGILAYRNASPLRQLTWFDRAGRKTGTVEDRVRVGPFNLSPDGTRLALTRMDVEGRSEDILTVDLQRSITSRFTLDPGSDTRPVWSPDGDRILFESSRTGVWRPYLKSTRGPGEVTLLSNTLVASPFDWSPDGTSLLVSVDNPEGDIAIVDVDDPENFRMVVPAETGADVARYSPDGTWFAYESSESGRREVFIQSLRGRDRMQVSTEGGSTPRWRGDGRELYYAAPGGFIMAVEIGYEPYLELSAPRALFVIPEGFRDYDVTRDGERFIASVSVEGIESKPLTVVLNWTEELDER